ncbi:MAG: TetR/AcrR family transcriptional regulator [Micropruina sp.]|uniref:TetR/AcrR family transcriptional regulator n=1 Tax=Micropruina sp. TaxID=2737536 RepID=UPI0039E2168C
MSRANPMTPDERRRALIEATRPLLLEHGMQITTRQIAECADVAEGTIFRAFGTKQNLIEAVVDDCMAPEPVVAAIEAIPADLDLEDTVTWMVRVLKGRIEQVRSLMSALAQSRPHGQRRRPPHRDFHRAVDEAMTRVLSRFDDRLTVGGPTACWAISAMAFAAVMPLADHPDATDPRQLARIILHGIATHSTEDTTC